ncbi:hypothetical protein F4818DRAFT_424640 [Hypoxylon cercidicola]|nr:hypothetical protein F4818DRAFT_424640 [Hypoxylon cercidicola]
MDKSPRSTSPHSTDGRSYASVVNSPVRKDTDGNVDATSSMRSGKLALKLKSVKDGQNSRVGLRDQKPRTDASSETVHPAPQASGNDENQVHDSQHPLSAATHRGRIAQQVHVPRLPPVRQPGVSKKGTSKDVQTAADQNAKMASMQATISMLNDDISRRTSELIEAKTTIAYKDSSINELKAEIQTLEDEYDDVVDERNQKENQTILDLRRENEALRDAIHTGLISIAQVYGPNSSQAFASVANEAMTHAASNQIPAESSPAHTQESSVASWPECSPAHSPVPAVAAPLSVPSGSTSQPRMLAGDASPQRQLCQSPEIPKEPKVVEAIGEPSEEATPLDTASELHKDQEVKNGQDTQENQLSKGSHETKEPQPAEEPNHHSKQVDDESASSNVKSNTPAGDPQTPEGSTNSTDEIRRSPTSLTAQTSSTVQVTADSRENHPPATNPPMIVPRSYATVASSPPKDETIAPRDRGNGKSVSPTQGIKDMSETHMSVSSSEVANSSWRGRVRGERKQTASSQTSDRTTPSFSKAKPNKLSARPVAQTKPSADQDGWESVKSKNKPKKNKKFKGKTQTQTQSHPASQAGTWVSGKPTSEESGSVPMSTKPMSGEKSVPTQTQNKWKRRTGTIIGSNSVFSQAAKKQNEEKQNEDKQSGSASQEHSGSRDVSNNGTGGQRSNSDVQSKPPPKKPAERRVNSMGSGDMKFNWADDVEEEFFKNNPDNNVYSGS